MTHVSFTELRQNLSHYLDQTVQGRTPVVVTRQGGRGNVVLMAEDEFAGWQETVHLLSSPRNAERLLRGLRSFRIPATAVVLRGLRQADAGELTAPDLLIAETPREG